MSTKKKFIKSKKFLGYKLDVDCYFNQIEWTHHSQSDNKENSTEINISLTRPQPGEYHLTFKKSIYTTSTNAESTIEIYSGRCNSERKARRIVIQHLKLY